MFSFYCSHFPFSLVYTLFSFSVFFVISCFGGKISPNHQMHKDMELVLEGGLSNPQNLVDLLHDMPGSQAVFLV
jgi:hypothetical protein